MKKSVAIIFVLACTAILSSAWIMSDNGKAGYTNSPGEVTCTNCHNSYALNSGGGSVYITSNLTNSNQYIPGQTYTINVVVKKTGVGLFGFGVEILNGNNNAGTLVITNAAKTLIKTKTVGGIVRNNVVHQLNAGLSTDSAVFSFDWTAPATNIGNVTIYFSGAACDNDGTETADFIYNDNMVITPTSAGLNEIENNFSLSVYPNPVTDLLNLRYHLTKPSMVKALLISTDGKVASVLFNEQQHAGEIEKSVMLPFGISKGNYLIQINTDQGKVVRKIIVN